MGSTEAARPAGKTNASVSTASRTASVASATSGLPALTPYNRDCRNRLAAAARVAPAATPIDAQRGSARQGGNNLLAARPECHADADLAAALGHGIAQKCVETCPTRASASKPNAATLESRRWRLRS